jgi:hypothetical protein
LNNRHFKHRGSRTLGIQLFDERSTIGKDRFLVDGPLLGRFLRVDGWRLVRRTRNRTSSSRSTSAAVHSRAFAPQIERHASMFGKISAVT